jgi:hypothetical protein
MSLSLQRPQAGCALSHFRFPMVHEKHALILVTEPIVVVSLLRKVAGMFNGNEYRQQQRRDNANINGLCHHVLRKSADSAGF